MLTYYKNYNKKTFTYFIIIKKKKSRQFYLSIQAHFNHCSFFCNNFSTFLSNGSIEYGLPFENYKLMIAFSFIMHEITIIIATTISNPFSSLCISYTWYNLKVNFICIHFFRKRWNWLT